MKELLFTLLAVILLASCVQVIEPCDGLEGMDRFTEEAIDRCGCPDGDKTPEFIEIPECDEDSNIVREK